MKNLIILSLLLKSALLWGQDLEEITLQELSSSQRSITIDKGELDGFKEGLFAKFYLQQGIAAPKLYLVAEGELIKNFSGKSYWTLKQVHIPKALTLGRKLLIQNSATVISGRPLKVAKKTVVISEKDYESVEDYLDKNTEVVPDRLVKVGNSFKSEAELFSSKDSHREGDVEISQYEIMKKKSGSRHSEEYGDQKEEKYFDQTSEAPVAEIKKAENKKLFDSVSDGVQKKTNNIKFGLKGFYQDQEKLKGQPDLTKKISISSVYDEKMDAESIAEQISPKAEAKYQRDGGLWSADMDDASLRRYFVETGLEKESKRRERVLNEFDGNEVMLHFSNGLSDHTTADDPDNRARGYNFGLSYDLHLSRASIGLKNWSLQFLYEKGAANYIIAEGINAHSVESAYGVYMNYYFYNNPATVNAFIFLAGVGIKNGKAKISINEFGSDYSYQVLTSPAFQFMTKYRFRSGDLKDDSVNIGTSLNLGMALESKSLAAKGELPDSVNGKFSVSDLRYTLGMSVYF